MHSVVKSAAAASFPRVWRHAWWSLALTAAVLQTGCAHRPITTAPPASNPTAAWTGRQADLARTQNWKLHARVSVRDAKNGFSAGLDWYQKGDESVLELFDPLGRKTAVLKRSSRGAEITTSKGDRAEAADAEALMQRLLGWSAPVTSLRYWVLGIGDPTVKPAAESTLDAAGRASELRQLGWTIKYPEYDDTRTPALPHLILASGQRLQIKLLTKEWQLVVPAAPGSGLSGPLTVPAHR